MAPLRTSAWLACASWLLAGAVAAHAQPGITPSPTTAPDDPPRGAEVWFSIGLVGGITQLSRSLADYQWNTTARPSWGAQALAGGERCSGGARLWSTHTRQDLGDVAAASSVQVTSGELLGECRLGRARGTEILGRASGGWLHVGYHPDQVTFQPSGGGGSIVVDLAPIDTWTAGGGLGLRRPLGPRWSVGMAFEARAFGMETARSVGGTVEVGRETFRDWSARVELSRLYRRR